MLTGVLAFLLLIIALLAIPVTLTYQVFWPQVLQNDADLEWAFGLVHVRIPSSNSKAPSSHGEEPKRKTDRSERSSRKKPNVFAAVRQEPFRRRIFRFISDLWRAIHKKDVYLRVRVGLGDPADTGQLWAVFGPVAGILANVREASINIEPDFFDTTVELDSAGSIRIIPLQMVYLTVALLLSPRVWQGVLQMRKGGA